MICNYIRKFEDHKPRLFEKTEHISSLAHVNHSSEPMMYQTTEDFQ